MATDGPAWTAAILELRCNSAQFTICNGDMLHIKDTIFRDGEWKTKELSLRGVIPADLCWEIGMEGVYRAMNSGHYKLDYAEVPLDANVTAAAWAVMANEAKAEMLQAKRDEIAAENS